MIDKLKSLFVFISLVVTVLAACDKVHQFPEPGKEVDPTEINLTLQVTSLLPISEYSIVTKNAQVLDPAGEVASKYDRRFVVQIRSNEYVDTLVESHTVTRSADDVSDLIVRTKLQTRKYKVVVWMDYVLKGTETDCYYLTGNGTELNAVHQPSSGKYVGGSDFKDAQSVAQNLDLTAYAGQWSADITVQVPLTRPVAKITILSNDLAEYAESIGYTGSLEELADQFVLYFKYEGYYPTGFNAYTGRLNDSESGYGFDSYANYPYNLEKVDYTRIGFDYVFVNGESSSITVTVLITNKSGQFVNEVNNVVIPVTRGKETVLIYKFFTKEYVPGIGINPEFDGEFNVYV